MPWHCALHIPDMALQAAEAVEPSWASLPYALAPQVQDQPLTCIHAVSAPALALGLLPGMRLQEVRQRWPQISVHPLLPETVERLRTALCHLAESLTPSYEMRSDVLCLDLSGCERLYGRDRLRPLREFRCRVMESTGLRRLPGIVAPHRWSAQILCRCPWVRDLEECPANEERLWLERVPLASIPDLEPSSRQSLHSYNLRTLGDIRRLDRQFLLRHLGATGERLYALAQGLDLTPHPSHSQNWPIQQHLFARDTNHSELIRGELHQAADRLTHELRRQGLQADQLRLRLTYADGVDSKTQAPVQPATDAFSTLLEVALGLLNICHQRRTAVRALELSAPEPVSAQRQCDLFAQENPQQSALAASLDRVRNKHGFTAVRNPLTPS